MTRQGVSGGGGTAGASQRPRRAIAVGCKALLALAMLGACCVDVAHAFSSTIACPIDVLTCVGNGDCGTCLTLLQATGLSLGDVEFEVCSELYADTCVTAGSVGCNVENEELVDLISCVFDETFSCGDFTTCADATAGLVAATATAVPAATPAPSPGSRGSILPPTAAPTADGLGAFSTAFPSPAVFEGTTADTMAPSESSAAPTRVDGLRGGIGSVFSAAPTAAPTGFEVVDDIEDGANGGISSRHAAATVARWCVVFATVLVGLNSVFAALAI